jgi:hypothetical protein
MARPRRVRPALSRLPVAVRAYTAPRQEKDEPPWVPDPKWGQYVLVLDTETRIDASQALLVGSYRFAEWRRTRLRVLEEGLFHPDALPDESPGEFAILEAYARSHRADVGRGEPRALQLYSLSVFLQEVFWPAAYDARAIIVAFNLPFDLSRLAFDVGEARGQSTAGGFSLAVARRPNGKEDLARTRIAIRHLDSKRAITRFTAPARCVKRDKEDEKPYPGRFLDPRTLTFALTDKSLTLSAACVEFGLPALDKSVEHGVITPEYLDYNRTDVRATLRLLKRLRAEFDRHPIALDPCRAFSPATLAKAYLAAMGVTPPDRRLAPSPALCGIAMSTYYGGRTEVRIRRVAVPIVPVDFLSQYPSVHQLLGTWRLLTAKRVRLDDVTDAFRTFLSGLTLEAAFRPETWAQLAVFVEHEPDGGLWPVRAPYGEDPHQFTIGNNPLTAHRWLWSTGPDVVASVLRNGQVPAIRQVLRLVPEGRMTGLRPVKLRGEIRVDPAREDFFRVAIQERVRVGKSTTLGHFLKIVANSGAYGIFAQVDRHPRRKRDPVATTVYGLDGPFEAPVRAHESPGPFSYPPVAALITAGGRLLLALAECLLARHGGVSAYADTDALAIVATKDGGLVPSPGGPHRLPDGRDAVVALSWAEVDAAILAPFAAFNRYDLAIIPGSILTLEKENFDAAGARQQVWVYAIAAKRYARFARDPDGAITILKACEHGLGHLIAPCSPDAAGRSWMAQIWHRVICEAEGMPVGPVPEWFAQPALMRLTASTPRLLAPFQRLRGQDAYAKRIKPFNFLLSAIVAKQGHPPDADPRRFHLVAPYTSDPDAWRRLTWFDIHSGQPYGLTLNRAAGGRMACVRTIGDIVADYAVHPEPKSLGPDGLPCHRDTVGLLSPRPVELEELLYTGKEANLLEEVEQQLVHDWAEVLEVYRDPRAWRRLLLPLLSRITRPTLATRTGLTERTLRRVFNEDRTPSADTLRCLVAVALEEARAIARQPAAPRERHRAATRLLHSPLARLGITAPDMHAGRRRKGA